MHAYSSHPLVASAIIAGIMLSFGQHGSFAFPLSRGSREFLVRCDLHSLPGYAGWDFKSRVANAKCSGWCPADDLVFEPGSSPSSTSSSSSSSSCVPIATRTVFKFFKQAAYLGGKNRRQPSNPWGLPNPNPNPTTASASKEPSNPWGLPNPEPTTASASKEEVDLAPKPAESTKSDDGACYLHKKAPGGDRARRSRGRRADDAWGYCCEGQGVCRQGPGCTGSVNSCLADPDCAPVKRPGRGPTFVVAPPVSSPINAADDASKGAAEDAVVGDGWEGDVQGRNGDDGCSACSCNGGLLTCSDIECRSPGVSVFDAEEHCNRAADRCMAIDDNAEACDAFKPCIDLWMLAGRLKFLEVPTACGCAIPEEEKDDNDCNDEWICEKMDFTTCRCFEPEGSEDVNAGCAAQNDHTGDAVCGWNADTEQCSGCPMLPEGDCKSSANPNCEWKKTVCGVVDDFTMTSPPFDSDGNKCV